MTDYEISVISNILYAVETGGNVYGNKDYGNFTEAYTNSEAEHAITIGAGGWMGAEAKKLLNRVKEANPSEFSRLDTAGIAADMAASNWSSYRISKNSAKAKCISAIIDTETGHRCQDQLAAEEMGAYMNEAAALGVTDTAAQMMCANFRHQGGYSAMTRVLAKTKQPYTLDNLYAACQTDTGNQVGTYRSRQKMVYESLKKYIEEFQVTSETAIDAVIRIAQGEVGYLEKDSAADLDSKTANAGDKNYTKYWRDIAPELQGSYWCAAFVTWVFVKAFGIEKTRELLKHYPYIQVAQLGSLFHNYDTPQKGDIVMYHNGSRFYHTGIVIEVNGNNFITIEGNTGPESGVNPNGGGVYQKTQTVNSRTKFARPDYSLVTTINSGGSGESPYPGDSWTPVGTATCGGDNVNVRSTPNGTVIGKLQKGNRFEVDGSTYGEWVHVKVAGIGVGYMHRDYVVYDTAQEDSWEAAGTATCGGSNVYVRKTPGGTVIGKLQQGNRFEVDGEVSGDWVHIKASGIGIGYMHKDYVVYDAVAGDSWNPTGTATSGGDNVRVRRTPNGTIIGKVQKGNRFEVDGTRSGEWVRVNVAGIGIGYIHEDYVIYDKNGSPNVKRAQTELNSRFGSGIAVDGIWGSASRKAFIAAMQSAMNSVYGEQLAVDGIWGGATESACARHALKEGDQNLYVAVLQIGLMGNEIGLDGNIDGSFGAATKAGVQQFQTIYGMQADGVAGINTFRKMAQLGASSSSGNWTATGTAYCTGNGVYVRKSPGGTVIGSVNKGDSFEVDGTTYGSWVHVRVAGIGIGYIHGNYVSYVSSGSNSCIRTAQSELNSRFGAGITVDGSWGAASRKAFIKAIQKALNDTYGLSLSEDGIWGSATENACAGHVLVRGSKNLYVGALQIGLHAHGISLSNGVDCDFGASTQQGVISFQTANGLAADGKAGKDTMKSLAGE